MATISASELACLRDGITNTWPETVTISRATRTSDNAGGYTTTWATVATVAGMLVADNTQPQEPVVGDRQNAVQRWMVRLPALTDVNARDRIVIGARTFEVDGVLGGGSYELTRTARCTEVL